MKSVRIIETDISSYRLNPLPEEENIYQLGRRSYLTDKEFNLIQRAEKLNKIAQGILDRAYRREK